MMFSAERLLLVIQMLNSYFSCIKFKITRREAQESEKKIIGI